MKIYLASKSPRRQELMRFLFNEFEVFPSFFDEDDLIRGNLASYEFVMGLAERKAKEAIKRLPLNEEFILISCDTVVYINDEIFGKPKSKEDAFNMLNALQGTCHEVYTGVCIIKGFEGKAVKFYEMTDVYFDNMSSLEIEEYLSSGEYMDKAGAYGIQGYASKYIAKIHGCYYNVMGFPVNKIYNHLKGIWFKYLFI